MFLCGICSKRDSTKPFIPNGGEYDKEFDGFHWLSFDEMLLSQLKKLIHMHRWLEKSESLKNYPKLAIQKSIP